MWASLLYHKTLSECSSCLTNIVGASPMISLLRCHPGKPDHPAVSHEDQAWIKSGIMERLLERIFYSRDRTNVRISGRSPISAHRRPARSHCPISRRYQEWL